MYVLRNEDTFGWQGSKSVAIVADASGGVNLKLAGVGAVRAFSIRPEQLRCPQRLSESEGSASGIRKEPYRSFVSGNFVIIPSPGEKGSLLRLS